LTQSELDNIPLITPKNRTLFAKLEDFFGIKLKIITIKNEETGEGPCNVAYSSPSVGTLNSKFLFLQENCMWIQIGTNQNKRYPCDKCGIDFRTKQQQDLHTAANTV
jgi:hypothetical protein